MSERKRFPMHRGSTRNFRDYPTSMPWEMVEPHREQIERNHNQTLERLAERGGLSPSELLAGIEGRRLDFSLGEKRIAQNAEIIRGMIYDAEGLDERAQELLRMKRDEGPDGVRRNPKAVARRLLKFPNSGNTRDARLLAQAYLEADGEIAAMQRITNSQSMEIAELRESLKLAQEAGK